MRSRKRASRSEPVEILQSGDFSEVYFFFFFSPPKKAEAVGFVLCAECEGVKVFRESEIHPKSFLHSTGARKERKSFAKIGCYSPISAKTTPQKYRCNPVNPYPLRS